MSSKRLPGKPQPVKTNPSMQGTIRIAGSQATSAASAAVILFSAWRRTRLDRHRCLATPLGSEQTCTVRAMCVQWVVPPSGSPCSPLPRTLQFSPTLPYAVLPHASGRTPASCSSWKTVWALKEGHPHNSVSIIRHLSDNDTDIEHCWGALPTVP